MAAEELNAAAAERATYGLPAEPAAIQEIVRTGQDVGTRTWGIVLTAAEEAALDLPGRMHFVNQLSEDLLPYAEGLSTFGGAFIAPDEGGRLVVNLTELDPKVVARLHELAPAPNRGVEVRVVEHLLSDLTDRAELASSRWAETSAVDLLSVGVDSERNGLVLRVLPEDLPKASADVVAFASGLGVPVAALEGEPDRDMNHHCAVRYDCHNPSRAGALLQNDFIGSNVFCTMGFHILVNGDKQFMTAGHCGYNRPAD